MAAPSPQKKAFARRKTKLRRASEDGVRDLEKRLLNIALTDVEPLLGFVGVLSENNPKMFDTIKEKVRKAFSSWTWKNVEEFLSLPTIDGDEILELTPRSAIVAEERIKDFLRSFRYGERCFGNIHSGNEDKRKVFITELLMIVLDPFSKSVLVKTEDPLISNVAVGKVEFVLHSLGTSIIFIVEAKQQSTQEGLGQLLMELYAACHMNIAIGMESVPLCGAVSQGDEWTFVEFHRPYRSIRVSKPFSIKASTDAVGLRVVAGMLFSFVLEGFSATAAATLSLVREEVKRMSADSADPNDDFFIEVTKLEQEMKTQVNSLNTAVNAAKVAIDDASAVTAAQQIDAQAAIWGALSRTWNHLKRDVQAVDVE